MRCNVGGEDKTLRLIVGAETLMLAAAAPLPVAPRAALFVVSAFAFLTVAAGYCPLNNVRGVNTSEHTRSPSNDRH